MNYFKHLTPRRRGAGMPAPSPPARSPPQCTGGHRARRRPYSRLPPTAVANTQGTAQTLPVVATVGDPLVPLDPAAIRLEAPAAATVDGDGTVVVVPGEGGYELDRDGGHRSSARKTHDTDNSDTLITAKEAQRHWGHKWVKPTSFSSKHHRTLSKANWSERLSWEPTKRRSWARTPFETVC